MVNDSISDMVCRVRNGCLAKKSIVAMPVTRVNQQIARILEQEGFIQSFFLSMEEFKPTLTLRLKYRSKQFLEKGRYVTSKTSCITNLKRISKPGLRIYTNHKEIPRILGGAGVVLLSTPSGVLTDREARVRGIGGEVLCSVW
jgi:small subunit ribosomal protein S8